MVPFYEKISKSWDIILNGLQVVMIIWNIINAKTPRR